MTEQHAKFLDEVLAHLGIGDVSIRTAILKDWTEYDPKLSATSQAPQLRAFATEWLKAHRAT